MKTSQTKVNEIENSLGTQFEGPSLDHTYQVYSSYQEWADVPVQSCDVIDQVHENLRVLADLQNRTRFMFRDIRSVVKVRVD